MFLWCVNFLTRIPFQIRESTENKYSKEPRLFVSTPLELRLHFLTSTMGPQNFPEKSSVQAARAASPMSSEAAAL